MVEVLGHNLAKPPLYKGDDVKTIVIRDSVGNAMIVIINIDGDLWGVSSSKDSDWKVILEKFGVKEKIQPD